MMLNSRFAYEAKLKPFQCNGHQRTGVQPQIGTRFMPRREEIEGRSGKTDFFLNRAVWCPGKEASRESGRPVFKVTAPSRHERRPPHNTILRFSTDQPQRRLNTPIIQLLFYYLPLYYLKKAYRCCTVSYDINNLFIDLIKCFI